MEDQKDNKQSPRKEVKEDSSIAIKFIIIIAVFLLLILGFIFVRHF